MASSSSSTTADQRNRRIREFVLKEYLGGCRANEIVTRLNLELSETVCRATVERWMMKFRSGAYTIADKPKTGRRARAHPAVILEMIQADPLISATEIYCLLRLGRTTVTSIINGLQLTNLNKMWVPRTPSAVLLNARMTTCRSLLFRNGQDPFLDRVIFEGERIIYYNVKKDDLKQDRAIPRPLIFQLWWDRQGPIKYTLKEEGPLTVDTYIGEIKDLIRALETQRPHLPMDRLIIHHNSTDHLSPDNNQFVQELGWDQIYHPKSSPDLSPTNYCLFQHLQYYVQSVVHETAEEVGQVVSRFFKSRENSKHDKFYERAIDELPERWAKVLGRQGAYIETNEKKRNAH